MIEFLILAAVVVAAMWLFGSKAGRHKGCRDCTACLQPAVWRGMVAVTWGVVRGPFVAFLSCCPECGHVVSRHEFRADGSYID